MKAALKAKLLGDKRLLGGAGVALVAGLLMGAVAKPDLASDDRPAGPQMMAGWSGTRSTGPFDDGATFAAFNGQIPDYVLGTDWKKSLEPVYAPDPEPRVRETRLARNDDPPELPLTPAAYDDTPPPEVTYPSMHGGEPARPDPTLPPPAEGDDTGAG